MQVHSCDLRLFVRKSFVSITFLLKFLLMLPVPFNLHCYILYFSEGVYVKAVYHGFMKQIKNKPKSNLVYSRFENLSQIQKENKSK